MYLTLAPSGRFELHNTTDEQSKIATKGGWRLDGRKFCFYTGSAELASPYIQLGDQRCVEAVLHHQSSIFFSKATTSSGLHIPCPNGLEYLEFQTIGTYYASQRTNSLIADEPGLGKTIQAIGLMNLDPSIKHTLVICPSIVKSNWYRELVKWFIRLDSVGICYSDEPFPRTKIVIINYDIIKKFRSEIDKVEWDLLILDESQYLKSDASKRSKYVLGDSTTKLPRISSKKWVFLSGTPLVNRPEDLWTTIKVCDPTDLGANWEYYGKRYCQLWRAPWGWDSSGAAHLEELQNRLRGKFMVRRLKRDVLKDLPQKKRQMVVLPAPPEVQKLLQEEKNAYYKVQTKLELVIEAAEAALATTDQLGDWDSWKKEADGLGKSNFSQFTELSRLRHEVALAKAPHAIEYIGLQLNHYSKVVVFAHHVDLIEQLYQAFCLKVGTVKVIGGDDEKKREEKINKFQTDPMCRLVISAVTISVGFHYTAANYALFVEADWRASANLQCEDRLHRIGQKNEVIAQYLCFQDSTDSLIIDKNIRKTEISEKALG